MPVEADIELDRESRTLLNGLSGWGIFSPITVSFDGDLDVQAIYRDPLGPNGFAITNALRVHLSP